MRAILAKDQIIDFRLEKLVESFRYRNRDFIFLVEKSKKMLPYIDNVTRILLSIMQEKKEDSIENRDRVSLIKFNRRLRKTFSLV